MAITEQIVTAEQFLQAPDLGPCELVRGEVIMGPPAGDEHGRIGTMGILGALISFVEQRDLGIVYAPDTGFQIAHDPDTVRVPDAAFLRADRIAPGRPKGFVQGAPDLVVEIISPSDRTGEVQAKVFEWLDAGCRMLWLVDPDARAVSVYRSRTDKVVLGEGDTLSGGDVLPGFSLPVARIFRSAARG